MTLAAGCSLRFSRAAAATSFALPAFARQARRPLGAELQINVRAGEVCARNRILRDDTTVVFDFNLHVIVRQHFVAKLENLGEGAGFQPVVIIVADPRLQQASISGFVNLAPAIDESLGDVAHFGNVEVPWNFVAIRQDKACDRVGVKGKRGFKFFQLHAGFYMRTTEYSQAQRFWNWKDGGRSGPLGDSYWDRNSSKTIQVQCANLAGFSRSQVQLGNEKVQLVRLPNNRVVRFRSRPRNGSAQISDKLLRASSRSRNRVAEI